MTKAAKNTGKPTLKASVVKSQAKQSVTKKPGKAVGRRPLNSGRNIVPRDTIAGSSLILVISIMSFLACATLGAVAMVKSSSDKWRSDISREVTIQIKPADDGSMDDAIRQASRIALSFEGIAKVTALSDTATQRLLEPWLGSGLELAELPVPRLLTVSMEDGATPDFDALRKQLEAEVPGASLDDHRGWVDRLNTMAFTMVAIGIVVFLLVIAATALTVVFATRGALSGNRNVVEVLHFVGADGIFISRQFQKHFLALGLKGAVAGGVISIVMFVLLGFWTSVREATPDGEQISVLFGTFSPGALGFGGMVLVIVLIALMVAVTSRMTVQRQVEILQDYRRNF